MIRLAVVAFAALVVAAPSDAAGPTDFRTTVVSVTPPTEGIDVAVIGGDSFLELTAEPGVDVVVLGYQQEPYLHFRPDGVVEENERSPTAYLNADRYGGGEVPAGADATLPPNWRQVGSGGRYAWHDHRAHWMDPNPPTVGAPGMQIQAATIPLQVDGVPVEVAVKTDWLPEPSRLPLAVGAAVGLGLVLLTVLLRRRLAWALLAVAAAATGIGWWQYRSLPAETEPAVRLVAAPGAGHGVRARRPRPRMATAVVRPRAARLDASGVVGLHPARRGVPGDHPDRRAVLARSCRDGGRRGRRRDRRARRGGDDVPPP